MQSSYGRMDCSALIPTGRILKVSITKPCIVGKSEDLTRQSNLYFVCRQVSEPNSKTDVTKTGTEQAISVVNLEYYSTSGGTEWLVWVLLLTSSTERSTLEVDSRWNSLTFMETKG
jgi:hypothetical protein